MLCSSRGAPATRLDPTRHAGCVPLPRSCQASTTSCLPGFLFLDRYPAEAARTFSHFFFSPASCKCLRLGSMPPGPATLPLHLFLFLSWLSWQLLGVPELAEVSVLELAERLAEFAGQAPQACCKSCRFLGRAFLSHAKRSSNSRRA